VNVVALLLAPYLALTVALLQVRWSTHSQEGITIEAPSREQQIIDCLGSSQQARLRFEIRLCRKRSGWLDHCEDARSELHTARYDDVNESYRVVSDRFGDDLEPIAVNVGSRTEAVRLSRTLQSLPLGFLLREEPELLSNPNTYLQIRTIFVCRGSTSRPLAHLSRILTLGLVDTVEDRSDWEDFTLSTKNTITPR
jgi:hypothetical protein